MRPSEVEVARPVVAHFKALGQTFPEVVMSAYGSRADLVCRRPDGTLDVVEVKVAPCAKLLRQVECWERTADRVWAAYRAPRRGGARWAFQFKDRGVGVIEVAGGTVFVRHEPADDRDPDPYWWKRLNEALSPLHAEYAEAGNSESRYLSAFRVTCTNLLEAVRSSPGITMKEAVSRISHHYASARGAQSSLLSWVIAGKVPGVEARPVKGARRYVLFETSP